MLEEAGIEVWRRFLKAHAAVIGSIERDLEQEGAVSLIWYDVLVAISSAPQKRLRLRDLGHELVLTRSGATRLADRLESAGLVVREPAGDDRRGTLLALTGAGRKALRAAWPIYERGIRRGFLGKLEPSELKVLGRALGRVAAVGD